MNEAIPFKGVDWKGVVKVEYPGTTGTSFWQTLSFAHLRIRKVEYSSGYIADHWCPKGHIAHCLEGSFDCEIQGDMTFRVEKGMSFVVSDELSSHRSVSKSGAIVLIIDGDFLTSP